MARAARAAADWETEALVDRVVYLPADRALVRLLLPTRATPNGITLWSFVAGFASACCFLELTPPLMLLGGVLLWLSNVLDGVDGQLARARGQCSELGKLLDNVVDPVKTGFVFLFLAIGLYRAHGGGSLDPWAEAPILVRSFGLAMLAAASALAMTLGHDKVLKVWAEHALGRRQSRLAHVDSVRAELSVLRARGGHRLERAVAALGLFFTREKSKPHSAEPLAPSASYREALRPWMRAWSFLSGPNFFTVLAVAAAFGEPAWGLWFVGVGMQVAFWPILIGTIGAHRRALGLSEAVLSEVHDAHR